MERARPLRVGCQNALEVRSSGAGVVPTSISVVDRPPHFLGIWVVSVVTPGEKGKAPLSGPFDASSRCRETTDYSGGCREQLPGFWHDDRVDDVDNAVGRCDIGLRDVRAVDLNTRR